MEDLIANEHHRVAICLGTSPTGSDGDKARIAFDKAQKNFTELYTIKADKGKDGVWPDSIPLATNMFAGAQIQWRPPSAANIRQPHGVIFSVSNTGHIYVSQSINGDPFKS